MSKQKIIKKEKSKPVVVLTNQQAQAEFVKKVGKPADGANASPVEAFLRVMDYIVAEKKSFCMSDIYSLARPYNISNFEIEKLAEKWISVMEKLHKVEVIDASVSPYDENVIL